MTHQAAAEQYSCTRWNAITAVMPSHPASRSSPRIRPTPYDPISHAASAIPTAPPITAPTLMRRSSCVRSIAPESALR